MEILVNFYIKFNILNGKKTSTFKQNKLTSSQANHHQNLEKDQQIDQKRYPK